MVKNKDKVETIATPEIKTPDPERAEVEFSYDSEGMYQVQVIKTCLIDKDVPRCEADAEDLKNRILIGLSSSKGVRVIKPKIVTDVIDKK